MKPFLSLVTLCVFLSNAAGAVELDEAKAFQAEVQFLKSYYAERTLDLKSLLPKDYVKSGEARGDLDGDGIDDLVIIIHKDPSANKTAKGDLSGGFDLPQFVVILTGSKSGQLKMWKFGQSHFHHAMTSQMEENGLRGFEIKKGVLSFTADFALSMGGWSAGGCTQKWRNGKTGFQLIGLTVENMDRKCACGQTTDQNLLTGAKQVTSDQKQDGSQASKTTTKKIKDAPQTVLWEDFDYERYCEAG